MKKIFLFLLFWIFGGSFLAWSCPRPEALEKSFKNLFGQQPFKVSEVRPTKVKGICEVIIESRGQRKLTYVDESGQYLILGRLIEISTRKDLTQERVAELNRLTPEQLRDLEGLVAFEKGRGPVVYLVVDPDCPHCKRAEKIVSDFAQEGKIRVKVILMPLQSLHPQAKAKAIGIICDGKGLTALIEGYQGKNCPEGKKKVEKTLKTLPRYGIRATPTYIFSDGRVFVGVLDREKLLNLLKTSKE